MVFNKNKIYTKTLVGFSIFCSLLSLLLSSFNKGEIYPFFHYKLYPQPLGAKHHVSEYRIYAKSLKDSTFKRYPIASINGFDNHGYIHTLNRLVNKVLESKSDITSQNQLYIFVKHVVPDKEFYKIIKETYNPELYINSENAKKYDTISVITF